MTHKLETRVLAITPEEIRAEPDADSRKLVGTVITYGRIIEHRWFRERFQAGCFTEWLKDNPDKTRALYQHDAGQLLGSTKNGTLTLRDTKTALTFELEVAKTSYGDDVLELVRAGEVRGMSFGFNVIEQGERFDREGDDPALRTVVAATLPEITVTSIPAYGDATNVSVRSAEHIDEKAIAQAKALVDRPEFRKREQAFYRQLAQQAA